jgi:hypothetical protein
LVVVLLCGPRHPAPFGPLLAREEVVPLCRPRTLSKGNQVNIPEPDQMGAVGGPPPDRSWVEVWW